MSAILEGVQPRELLLYYGGVLTAVLLMVLLYRRPRRGMRLRLKGGTHAAARGGLMSGINGGGGGGGLEGGASARAGNGGPGRKGQESISPMPAERPLNVMFNYNGHTWDAYEVLGLPAGSSIENAESALLQGLKKVNEDSRPFLEAAFGAIQAQWQSYHRGVSNG